MQIASMSANADQISVTGNVTREGSRFLVTVEGARVGPPVGTIQAAAERLGHALGQRLPNNPASWGVSMTCADGLLNVVVGNLGGRGGGEVHPCVARVLRGRSFPTLEAALAAFAHVIGACCS